MKTYPVLLICQIVQSFEIYCRVRTALRFVSSYSHLFYKNFAPNSHKQALDLESTPGDTLLFEVTYENRGSQ